MNDNIKYLDGWIFTYSDANGKWSATTRDFAAELFNNYGSKFVIRSSSDATLKDLIIRAKGQLEEIGKSIK